jgi:endonuclease YncB( thermonuclease family)
MKKLLISLILWISIIYPVSSSVSLIHKINSQNAEYRNRVIYVLTDFISQIKKDDVKFWPFKVLRVLDWDTFEIDYFWEKEKVRVYWIDTPEKKEEWYTEASEFARNLLLNKEVYIKRINRDRGSFGRLLREVYIDDVNFWELMLERWYAEVY